MSDTVAVDKRSTILVSSLMKTLIRLELADPEVDFSGRHREDRIIKAWMYGKKYGRE